MASQKRHPNNQSEEVQTGHISSVNKFRDKGTHTQSWRAPQHLRHENGPIGDNKTKDATEEIAVRRIPSGHVLIEADPQLRRVTAHIKKESQHTR